MIELERYALVKGYATVLKRRQKRLFAYQRSNTYENAYWAPEYRGAKKYILKGIEVPRQPKTICRLVWSISFRDTDKKVRKDQTHITTIQYWRVIDDFKSFLHYWQTEIETGSKTSPSGFFVSTHLPGHVACLEEAVNEFVRSFRMEDGIFDGAEKMLKRRNGSCNPRDLESVLEKLDRKWDPIKKSIVREYCESHEFAVWLANEATRRAGPRRPTEEERRDQERSERQFNNFKESFRHSFSGGRQRYEDDDSHYEPGSAACDNIQNREMATKLIQKWFRMLSKKYHPDVGGDTESMRKLLDEKDKLLKLLS